MKRNILFFLAFTSFAISLFASPTPTPSPKRSLSKSEKESGGQRTLFEAIAQSANGWSYFKGEWIHPDGYKYVEGQVLRTTAKAGKTVPQPPGKLAQENARKLTPAATSAQDNAKTTAKTAAETRRKNLIPIPVPQTGSHL